MPIGVYDIFNVFSAKSNNKSSVIRLTMEKAQAFKEIERNISLNRLDAAGSLISEVVHQCRDDPFTLLSCISLFRVIGYDRQAAETVKSLMADLPDNETSRLEIARGLRNLGYPSEAAAALSGTGDDPGIARELALALGDSGRYGDALAALEDVSEPTVDDDIFRAAMLSASGRHEEAVSTAESLLKEDPDRFEIRKCYCSVLMAAGREKDAEKYVRAQMKSDKTADGTALAAFFMWIMGKVNVAGGYAAKAVKEDNSHVGAMEILGYTLVAKGKINEAKIVAGAINEKYPGHPAVMKILDMCKDQ